MKRDTSESALLTSTSHGMSKKRKKTIIKGKDKQTADSRASGHKEQKKQIRNCLVSFVRRKVIRRKIAPNKPNDVLKKVCFSTY